jgi:hypothetical protein
MISGNSATKALLTKYRVLIESFDSQPEQFDMSTKTATAIEPALLDVNAIQIKLSCSKPLVYRYFEDGTLKFIMQGRRRFATHKMIDDCIQRLAEMGGPKPSESVNNRWRKKGTSVQVTRAKIDAATEPAKKKVKR